MTDEQLDAIDAARWKANKMKEMLAAPNYPLVRYRSESSIQTRAKRYDYPHDEDNSEQGARIRNQSL